MFLIWFQICFVCDHLMVQVKKMHRQRNRQTDVWADRMMDGWKDRQIDRQTDTLTTLETMVANWYCIQKWGHKKWKFWKTNIHLKYLRKYSGKLSYVCNNDLHWQLERSSSSILLVIPVALWDTNPSISCHGFTREKIKDLRYQIWYKSMVHVLTMYISFKDMQLQFSLRVVQ